MDAQDKVLDAKTFDEIKVETLKVLPLTHLDM